MTERSNPQGRAMRWWWPLVPALLLSIYAAGGIVRPQALDADAAAGFLTWQSSQRGAPWNHFAMVEPANLAAQQLRFTAWWSPGQYVVPTLLMTLGLTLAQAVWAVTAAALVLGVIGYYRLFLALAVPVATSRLAATLMTASIVVAAEFRTYSGGETLVFGATPWIVLVAVRTLTWSTLRRTLLLFALFLVGIFLKQSFIITAVAVLGSLYLLSVRRRDGATNTGTREALAAVAVAALLYGTMLVFFLRFGDHQSPHGLDLSPLSILHPLAGGLLAAVGIGEVAGDWDAPTLTTIVALSAAAAAHLALLGWLVRTRRLGATYRGFAIGFAFAYAALLLYCYVFVVGVNHGNRHFRAAGFVLLPALLTWIRNTPHRAIAVTVAFILAIGAVAGPVEYALRWRQHGDGAVGVYGLTQTASPRLLRAIHALDASAPADAVVLLPSAALSLELTRLRSLEVIGSDVPGYRGRVSDAFVLITHPSDTEEKLALFLDYPRGGWRHYLLDDATLYVQGISTDEQIVAWLGESLHPGHQARRGTR